jgi:hypothetical protein
MNGEKNPAQKAPPVYRTQAVAVQSKAVLPGPPVYRPLAGAAQQRPAVGTGHIGAAPSRGAANVGGFPPVPQRTTQTGPPVYRPQQTALSAKSKMGGAPPVYRPVQTTSDQRTLQQKPGLIGPPVYRPQQGWSSAQSKTIAAFGVDRRAPIAPSQTAARQAPKLGAMTMSAGKTADLPRAVMSPSSPFVRRPSPPAPTAQPKLGTRFPTGAPAVLQRASSAKLLRGLAEPKVFQPTNDRIEMQQQVADRLEEILKRNSKTRWKHDPRLTIDQILDQKLPDAREPLVGLGAILFPQVFPDTVSGLISRCKLIEAPEPRAKGMAWFRPHMLDQNLERDIIINTVRTMEQAGQIEYLRASGLAGEDSYIVVEVHYYRERVQKMTGFHKDTVGQTVFVNLNYLNKDEEIAGPEFVVNPRNVAAHEQQIAETLPTRYLDDLAKARRKLLPPTKIKWAGNLPRYGVVTFTDELVHHATPSIALTEVTPVEIEAYRNRIHKKPENNPTNDDVDQDLKLWSLVREGKKKNRGDLLAAGIKEAHVNALIATAEPRAHVVSIAGVALDEVSPGKIEAYRKSIHKKPEDNPTNDDVDQDLKLWSLAREGKKKKRRDLLAAGIKEAHVNVLMATGEAAVGTIPGSMSEIVGPGQPALSRKISKVLLNPQPQTVPKVSDKPRTFFRSWVRTIKGRHPQRLG